MVKFFDMGGIKKKKIKLSKFYFLYIAYIQ